MWLDGNISALCSFDIAVTEMSGNFYKGTSKDQTPFFKDKDSQLIAQRKVSSVVTTYRGIVGSLIVLSTHQ